MWNIEFFEKDNGRCPVENFLDDLNPVTELPYVNDQIEKLKMYGNELSRPYCGFLKNDIYELRIKTKKKKIRILYFFYNRGVIIFTHGFVKKTRKIPQSEIKKLKNIEGFILREIGIKYEI